eukprot:CAMPEP_0119559140 /NCGR_PEP_ID=MMETSP1352-20130426/11938_1 /TAXON_ID=265584 /ORGANISM="Stauroneis constricta, Strain CCMP1120" /LENGTH=755 /DNA_ID=CAMNT_0007606731 /DNA_START=74 /DNA_END=2341 /DNA_ORIENTATION=-
MATDKKMMAAHQHTHSVFGRRQDDVEAPAAAGSPSGDSDASSNGMVGGMGKGFIAPSSMRKGMMHPQSKAGTGKKVLGRRNEQAYTHLDDYDNDDGNRNDNSNDNDHQSSKGNESDELPTNVSTMQQLKSLPDSCVSSSHPDRPLRHVHETGEVSHYALRPMAYSVLFILIVELLERFSFYGIEYTQTSYLTGAYDHTPDHDLDEDEEWNAGMTSIKAASYVSISTAVAYTTPFLGAYIADAVLGDYRSILVGSTLFYLPGILLITLTTVPHLLGDQFNNTLLTFGLLILWPFGTGMIKSIVNVFGARQFHPILQSSLIESYYVNFYMCVNVGALIGGFTVPVLAQHNITWAYSLCVVMLAMGVIVFILGTPRYVRQNKVSGSLFSSSDGIGDEVDGPFATNKSATGHVDMSTIFRVTILIMPFSITYSQMATTFIVQGTVMKKAYFIDAASMNNMDALSVLFFGYLIGAKLYPELSKRNMKIPTTYKFAMGSTFGALAICWAIFVEHKIHSTYNATGEQISVLWQAGSYILIGAGEIFAISTSYEAAFSIAPPQKKVLASAVNLFSYGGIPNVICIGIYNVCAPWFQNSRGTTSIIRIEDYTTAHVVRYFWTLLAIAIVGVIVNLLPPIRNFVDSTEQVATEAFRTPMMKKKIAKFKRSQRIQSDEASPLLRMKRHQAYLKYGSGPKLLKSGSIHSNPFDSGTKHMAQKSEYHVKREELSQLYGKVKSPRLPPRSPHETFGQQKLTEKDRKDTM